MPCVCDKGEFCPEHPPAPGPAFRNRDYRWLTYETVYNKPTFRKSNQARRVGLYAVRLDEVDIWVRDYLDDNTLRTLVRAFAPAYTEAESVIRAFSNNRWDWKKKEKREESFQPPSSPQALPASRQQTTIYTPTDVVLPYNYWDNTERSAAIGTSEVGGNPPLRARQLVPELHWRLWKTASRSSAMAVTEIDPTGWETDKIARAWTAWRFEDGAGERQALGQRYATEITGPDSLHLPDEANLFSVKTGVQFVGLHNQTSAGKDVIGEWIIACLRSDYVSYVDDMYETPKDLVLQTEVLTIVERQPRRKDIPGHGDVTDGVSVRDLAVLHRDRIYLPPLSIPFVDTDLQTPLAEFEKADDPAWTTFWRKHWAAALGRAKAFFLLRYALQHANPNVQNYLLEFVDARAATPVRVVIRDLQDAALHREVAWALFGPGGPPPQGKGGTAYAQLTELKLPVLRYQFEAPGLEKEETGSTNVQFGPPGAQFLWQRFSAHYSGARNLTSIAPGKARATLRTMAEWGIAHDIEYLRAVEESLGIELRAIRWHELAPPGRYITLAERELRPAYYGGTYTAVTQGTPRIRTISAKGYSVKEIRDVHQEKNPALTQAYKDAVRDAFLAIDRKYGKTFPVDEERHQWRAKVLQDPESLIAEQLGGRLTVRQLEAARALARGESVADVAGKMSGKPSALPGAKPPTWEQQITTWQTQPKFQGWVQALGRPAENIEDQYKQAEATAIDDLDRRNGFDQWTSVQTFDVFGTGFRDTATVTLDGYEILQQLVAGDDRIVCGVCGTEDFRNALRDQTLTVTVHQDGASVTLQPTLAGGLAWEEAAAGVIQDFLASPAGQDAIRAYRDNLWSPVPPLRTLRLTDAADTPLPWRIVRFQSGGETWYRPSDRDGHIPCYTALADGTQINLFDFGVATPLVLQGETLKPRT